MMESGALFPVARTRRGEDIGTRVRHAPRRRRAILSITLTLCTGKFHRYMYTLHFLMKRLWYF